MTTKKRILMCSESSHIKSGFGKYTRNILQRLHDTGKYEIAELSCYRDISVKKTEPWKVYPASASPNDPNYQEYKSNEANQYGQWIFEFALLDFKPHIVIDIRDFWNFTYQETSALRPFYHWMIVPTYDSAPAKISTINTFRNADILCFHTNWAKENLVQKYNYTTNNIKGVLSDSIDHDCFQPIEYNKTDHKLKYNIPANSIVIGSVMRNQKRKLIPDLIEVFANLVKNNKDKNILLYLHTSYPDGMSWDLPTLLIEHNIANKVLLTYQCNECNIFFPSLFMGPTTLCPSCKKHTASISSVKAGISELSLKEIYNIFDIYVQYSICEGFGIPPIEAAACGIPVITVDNEAMKEVGINIGAKLIKKSRIFREQDIESNRAYPDNQHLLESLQEYIDMPLEELNIIGKRCQKLCSENYSWDKTAKNFETIIDEIDITKKISWESNKRPVNTNHKINSKCSNNRQIIYDIIDNIIQEPFLKETNFIEELIKSTDQGYVQSGQKIHAFNIKSAIHLLEKYLTNKYSLEELRVNPSLKLPEQIQPFINYS